MAVTETLILTMVLVAGGFGLRASEIMAPQWGDFGGQGLTLAVTRGFVCGQPGGKDSALPSASAARF